MKSLIITSSSDTIDSYYLSIARSIADYLASQEFDLVFGAAATSMMGACYNAFVNQKRNVYAYTTLKYQDQFALLPDSKHYLEETTFDLKKDMFNESDIIVCLPGGIGTYSEILSFLEEKRSNNKYIPIIIYNENGFYNKLLNILDDLISNNFLDKSIYESFILVNNYDEFMNTISNIRRIMK